MAELKVACLQVMQNIRPEAAVEGRLAAINTIGQEETVK